MKIINDITELITVLMIMVFVMFVAMLCFGILTDLLSIVASFAIVLVGCVIMSVFADFLETYEYNYQETEG